VKALVPVLAGAALPPRVTSDGDGGAALVAVGFVAPDLGVSPAQELPAEASGPAGAGRDGGDPNTPRTRAEVRRLFLEQSAVGIGQRWADQWRSDLHREGRPAAGGWPGTLREARVRVERHFLAEAARRKISAVTQAEREVAARRAYASARARWCRQAEPEAP
jgi:hypothetical protein